MTVGNQTHIVTTGDKLHADTEIVDIESKQVTLQTSGQQRTLRLKTALWLNTSYTNRSPVRRQTPAGLPIRVGDARLKNPEKWGCTADNTLVYQLSVISCLNCDLWGLWIFGIGDAAYVATLLYNQRHSVVSNQQSETISGQLLAKSGSSSKRTSTLPAFGASGKEARFQTSPAKMGIRVKMEK